MPLDEDMPGWVSNFVDKLTKAVARHAGGSRVGFWMDHRLEPQRRVDDELRKRIRDSQVILAFLSPRYLESDWCRKEMHTFVEEVGGGGCAERVFLVEVLPTERAGWHAAIQDLTPVSFWTKTLVQPEPETLGWPVPNAKGDRDYWREVNRLASILARHVAALPSAPGTPQTASVEPVAATTPAEPPPADGPLSVLINADEPDRALGEQLQSMFAELDVDATLAAAPHAGQLPAEYRHQLEATLLDNRAVLIVYGRAPTQWVQAQHAHARKILALQRPGLWGALLDAPPPDKPPHGLPPRKLMTLDCRGGLCQEPLAQFVEALRGGSADV